MNAILAKPEVKRRKPSKGATTEEAKRNVNSDYSSIETKTTREHEVCILVSEFDWVERLPKNNH